MSGILVYALHYDGAFNKNSLGAVSEAARLAGAGSDDTMSRYRIGAIGGPVVGGGS